MDLNPEPEKDDHLHEENKKREHDPNFEGVVKTRSCTDTICLIIFFSFLLAQICLVGFAFYFGNPSVLLKPTDSFGNTCSQSKPYLIFFDLVSCARLGPMVVFTGCPTQEVCVSKCPNNSWSWISLEIAEKTAGNTLPDRRRSEMICVSSFDPGNSNMTIKDIISSELCAPYYLPSFPVMLRCMPLIQTKQNSNTSLTSDQGSWLVDSSGRNVTAVDVINGNIAMNHFFNVANWFQNVVADLTISWPIIFGCLVLAGILSIIWCLLMRYFSSVMIYITLIMFVMVFTAATIYCYIQYALKATTSAAGQIVISTDINVYLDLKEFWLGLAISGTIITIVIILILLFLRTRIKLAVAIITQASKAIGDVPTTLFAPIFPFLIQALAIGLWGAVTINLASIRYANYGKVPSAYVGNTVYNFQNNPQDASSLLGDIPLTSCSNVTDFRCRFINYSSSNYVWTMQAYNLFMCFWVLCFIEACHVLSLAGVFALWYWTFDKNKMPPRPLLGSIYRLCRYHLGTCAFGSLTLAFVKFVRYILLMVQKSLKGGENSIAKFFLCCCSCCMWCLENVLRFLTKNAYIVTAMLGKPFCSAAKNSFFLIMRNCLRLFVVDSVTDFILLIGKLVITVLVGVSSFYIFNNGAFTKSIMIDNQSLNYYYVPMVLTILGSYCVCCLFFGIFNLAVDTLFICIMEDLERNDGSKDKPYFMSKRVKKVLKIKNEDLKDKEIPTGIFDEKIAVK